METLQCRICGSEMANPEKTAIRCAGCDAAFHRDCWLFNGQCGIYGCGSRTYVNYRERKEGEVVAIDETTRAPITFKPYIEAIMRTLPRWGRMVIPATSLGLAGSLAVCGLYFTLTPMPFSWILTTIFLGTGLGYSLMAVPMGGVIRRHSTRVAQVFAGIATGLYYLSRSFDGNMRAVLVASSVMLSMMLANAIAERLTAPYRLLPSPGPVTMAVLRAILTGVLLFGFLVFLTTLLGPHPVSTFIAEIACVSVLGFFVAAPPLELSKSAMIKHMQSVDDE